MTEDHARSIIIINRRVRTTHKSIVLNVDIECSIRISVSYRIRRCPRALRILRVLKLKKIIVPTAVECIM